MPGFGGNTVRAYLPSGGGASWRDWANVQGYLGSWRQATDVYANDNGTWKKVWIRLTAPTTVTATLNATGLDGTLTWSGAQGADGYYIYRNGVYSASAGGGGASSAAISVPDYDNNYTFSVASFFAGVTSSETSAAPVRANLATPVLSASLARGYSYSTLGNYASYGHISPDYPITTLSPQIALSWAALPGITNYQIILNGNTTSPLATVSGTSYTATSNTSANYQVRAVSPGNTVSGLSNTRSLNVGQPRNRGTTSGVSTGNAQTSHPGTTNGQFNVRFRGDLFNTWVYQVKWDLTVTSFTTTEITNYPGRKIRLTYPGGPFEVPDGRPLGWDTTIAVVGQDVTVGVDPYGNSWSSSGSGTIGTFHVDVTIRIYYTVVTQNEITPTVS